MEFPELGDNCAVSACKQLDFLPLKCDACQKIFCAQHFSYAKHSCTESYAKDNQVPVCPLCNTLIPLKKGEQPDVKVGQHIDNDCQSDPAKEKRKVYTNRCSMKGCKQKELIPFKCERCQMNYCIRHRLELDHDCAGFQGTGRAGTRAGAAAIARMSSASTPKSNSAPVRKPQQGPMTSMGKDLAREREMRMQQPTGTTAHHSIQAGMSEDEAMARAIAMSLQTTQPEQRPSETTQSQEEADRALAQALQASEQEAMRRPQRQRNPQPKKDKACVIA